MREEVSMFPFLLNSKWYARVEEQKEEKAVSCLFRSVSALRELCSAWGSPRNITRVTSCSSTLFYDDPVAVLRASLPDT